jgi:alpha-tubulin suppressor-like RCC1 family protein
MRWTLFFTGLSLALACAGTDTMAPPVPTSIRLTTSQPLSIVAGQTVQFSASVYDQNGAVMPEVAITLGVSPAEMGSISPSHLFTSAGRAGNAVITASSGTLSASVTITVAAGSASMLSKAAGDGQTATVGTTLPDSLRVKVTDSYGNAIPLVLVSWTVVSGDASVSPATSQTLTDGIAKARVTLGSQTGPISISAAFGSATATFTATAKAPDRLVLLRPPSSTATNRVLFSVQPVLQLQDGDGSPIARIGVPVIVGLRFGGNMGELHGTSTLLTTSEGTASWSDLFLSGQVGRYVLEFQAGDLSVQADVALQAGSAAKISPNAGNDQFTAPGTQVRIPPSVRIVDADGNLVSGVAVTFAVGSGGGSVTGSPATTNAQGIATVGSWTVGSAVGTSTLTATADGLAGSPVTFTARVGIVFASLDAGGGGEHTCGLTPAGVAYCWGDNRDGQLGDGTFTNRSSPVVARGGTVFKQLVTGVSHTCGLTPDGSVDCWGKGMAGLTTGGLTFRVLAGGGDGHLCGLATDGANYCWGSNTFGQLGDSTTVDRTSPVRVRMPSTLTPSFDRLAEGSAHTCGATSGRQSRVFCWGKNESGQIGDGTTTNRLIPTAINVMSSTIQYTALGPRHTCALTLAGAVHCWGGNESGQLGDGSTTNRAVPGGNVTANNGFAAYGVVAGGAHTCAFGVYVGGTGQPTTLCWGSNEFGQLGDGTQTNRAAPVTVVGGPSVFDALVAGTRHTCGRTPEGEVFCWGYNGLGALGNGTTTNSSTPVPVRAP